MHEQLSQSVIGVFFEVYNALGFGFLEQLYLNAMEIELSERGYSVAREQAVKVSYRGHDIGTHRLDMIVDQKIVIEVKSTNTIHPAAERQLFNYLKATHLDVGLLLHFGPKPAFKRAFCRRSRNSLYPSHPMYEDPL